MYPKMFAKLEKSKQRKPRGRRQRESQEEDRESQEADDREAHATEQDRERSTQQKTEGDMQQQVEGIGEIRQNIDESDSVEAAVYDLEELIVRIEWIKKDAKPRCWRRLNVEIPRLPPIFQGNVIHSGDRFRR
ncbi:Uncharacterized protein Rs2_44199 [Raphanus sativus]|nr:Uncharacterized protein Rs2_44199 [Raphanus sativus]